MSSAPHLCHVFPRFGRGGAQLRTAHVINRLGDRYRHTVIAVRGNLECRDRVQEPVEYVAYPEELSTVALLRRLWRTLGELEPDLLLTYNWGTVDALPVARLLGGWPTVHTEDGFNPDEAGGQKRRRVWGRRLLLRGVETVVVPSHVLEGIARRSWKVPPERLVRIPNGIDTDRFSPGDSVEARRALDLRGADFVVGTVGNLAGSKNVGLLMRSFARACDGEADRLLVVGDGPQRQELERLAASLGIADRVRFTGSVPKPLAHYRALDAYALSSRTEQMPLSLLEAMGVALPVVATDVGDVARMVAPENLRYVVPPGDQPRFADALRQLRSHPDGRREIGRANRERCVEEFDLRRVVSRYAEVYVAALGQTHRSSPAAC